MDEAELLVKLAKKLAKINSIYDSLLDADPIAEEPAKKEVVKKEVVKKEVVKKEPVKKVEDGPECIHMFKSGYKCIKKAGERDLCDAHRKLKMYNKTSLGKSQVVNFIKNLEPSE